ncbi:hypothetical protein V8B55DRAFT_1389761 [Mucor lusitanicus]|uniref:DUF2470 domain-containing protein n=2 Tax=Mucor circinelloides f. lusitanicus TaxID=29924 RepID=A0A168IXA5_MUCCL|nr:hypothetical protein FB192DRAFT_1128719 [Mucor lusitanicus]OAD00468.1 hypothetical protein MUCCIDRAFT_185336 [Mucor lusitanicus CBS 277.49]
MSDPIAPHSAPIAAYMSVHEATNLAYVRYFGHIDNATKATFKSLDSRSFQLDYYLPNDTEVHQISIPFKTPLQKREDIRPVLEAMAKEAEEALGLPSSLAGPPPLMAIAKAMAASTNVYTPPEPQVSLNSFYLPESKIMWSVGFGLSALALLACSSDAYLQRQFPAQVLAFRDKLGAELLYKIWKGAVIIHLAEGAYTFITCVRRGWYSPVNTIKWTLSSLLFGFGSLKQLKKHANDVAGIKSN